MKCVLIGNPEATGFGRVLLVGKWLGTTKAGNFTVEIEGEVLTVDSAVYRVVMLENDLEGVIRFDLPGNNFSHPSIDEVIRNLHISSSELRLEKILQEG